MRMRPSERTAGGAAARSMVEDALAGRTFGSVEQEGDTEGGDLRRSIVGPSGAARLGITNLADAEAMEREGADRTAIWRATGWWRGKDGKWRVEIPDIDTTDIENDLRRNMKDGRADIVSYWTWPAPLNKAYPRMGSVRLSVTVDREAYANFNHAGYSQGDMDSPEEISIYAENIDAVKPLLVHELQHRIQMIEGFAQGGSEFELKREGIETFQTNEDNSVGKVFMLEGTPYKSAHDAYRHIAGEVEARNTARRLSMSPEERAATPPWETEDVPESEQIVRFGNGGVSAMAEKSLDTEAGKSYNARPRRTHLNNESDTHDRGTEKDSRQRIVVGEREETPAVARTLEQVAAYAGGNDGAGEAARTLAGLDKPRFTALLGYAAKQEGAFISDLSKVADTRRVVGSGQESVVHPSREPGYVIKVNNFKLIDSEHSPLDFFEGIKAYNEFCPDTRLDIIGFTEDDAGDVFAVMRQKHVSAERHATQAEINRYFEERGFTTGRNKDGRIEHRSANYTILDAEPKNVLVGKDGELYPIDLVVSRAPAGAADGQTGGGVSQRLTDSREEEGGGNTAMFSGARSAAAIFGGHVRVRPDGRMDYSMVQDSLVARTRMIQGSPAFQFPSQRRRLAQIAAEAEAMVATDPEGAQALVDRALDAFDRDEEWVPSAKELSVLFMEEVCREQRALETESALEAISAHSLNATRPASVPSPRWSV